MSAPVSETVNWAAKRILHVAEVEVCGLHDAVDEAGRAACEHEPNRVEGNGHECTQTGVDDVSRRHVTPIGSAFDEHGLVAR